MEIDRLDFQMRELYKDVEFELDKINFNDLWKGFSKYEFALYNKRKVYLRNEEIPYDNRFLGNTSINYNGRSLAIWYVEDALKEDSKELAFNIVHEMFHSYQHSNEEKRFPNDLKGLDYPMDLRNFEIKHRENMLLVKALDSLNKDVKYNLLKEVISLRMSRLQKYGDIIKYEFAIETVEGSAEYCGTKALKIMSKELYKRRIENYKNILLNNIPLLFDIRRISYFTGVLFLILFEELNIPFTQDIKGQNQFIFEEVAEKMDYNAVNIDDISNSKIEEYFREYINNIEKKFEDFFNESVNKHEGNFLICGYDPMNMIKLRDMILCSNFIMLMDRTSQEKLFLNGPVVVKIKERTCNEVIEYYGKCSK